MATKFEPPHDKTNKMICASSEDSDQPGHLPSLSFRCALSGYLRTQAFFMRTAKTPIRLGGFQGWCESCHFVGFDLWRLIWLMACVRTSTIGDQHWWPLKYIILIGTNGHHWSPMFASAADRRSPNAWMVVRFGFKIPSQGQLFYITRIAKWFRAVVRVTEYSALNNYYQYFALHTLSWK